MTLPWMLSTANMRNEKLHAKLKALIGKGPPALILVDKPLPDGAIAEVHLNSTGPVPRFMVIPRATLDDEVIDRAYSLAKLYEMHNPDDQSPVTFRLAANGDFTRTSKDGEFRSHQEFQGYYVSSKKDRRSRWLLESAQRVAVTQIAGIGPGRIMSLGDPK
jgi:hypothetical protein